MEVPPHLVLELSFDSPDPAEAGPQVRLAKTGLDLVRLKPQVKERRASVSLQLPDVELEFFVNEDPALTNVAAAAKAQLQSFDRNKNGYLEKEELPERVPGLDATFESFDADSDGKVYEAEFLAYLQQRGAIARSQVRARAADQEDALFTALDTDGDGRLNSREMRETPAVLKAMDRDGDGKIQSHEIPGSMVVGFVRGNSQQDAQLFAGPSTNRAKAGSEDDQPRWFRGMDANSDREISRREFFGTVDQFQRLDANGDGYLQVEEVQQP